MAICMDLMECTEMPWHATSTLPVHDLMICFARLAFACLIKIYELEGLVAPQLACVAGWAMEADRVANL